MVEPSVSARYIEKAARIVEAADQKGVPLRLMGCIAVKMHSQKWSEFHENAMKRYATDVDLMTLSKSRGKVGEILSGLGYAPVRTTVPQEDRVIFVDSEGMHVDVFFDRLSMCHVIDFRDRLEVDSPTISLSDILLEKVQIVQINEKDIKDVIVLLREHDVGNEEKETINGDYIAKLLAKDWGFCYTATTNLRLIRDRLLEEGYTSILRDEDVNDVRVKIDKLLEMIENEPKSLAWKMRARTGTKKKWYQDVEEVQLRGDFEKELEKLLKGEQ